MFENYTSDNEVYFDESKRVYKYKLKFTDKYGDIINIGTAKIYIDMSKYDSKHFCFNPIILD